MALVTLLYAIFFADLGLAFSSNSHYKNTTFVSLVLLYLLWL